MRMVQRLVVSVILLMIGSATPVNAELTAAERADIKAFINSSAALRTGERYLAASIQCCSTSDARPALAKALDLFYDAQVDHWRALGFFLHTGTENPTPKPVLSAKSWHDNAWNHVDLYVAHLGEIESALTQAQAFHKTNATYQDNLRRARDIWVSNARTLAEGMNPALPYLTPWPALAAGKTVHTVVGPHGDYRMMQWDLNRGKNYALDTYVALITAYGQGASGTKIKEAWAHSSAMLDTLDRASGLLAGVTFTTEEAAEDRFCRTLRAQKLLTITAAERYQQWASAVSGLLAPPYGTIVANLAESWKRGIDGTSWRGLVFPESSRCTADFLEN